MGAEIRCRAMVDGKPVDGVAMLESSEIIFRPDEGRRVLLPFAQLRELRDDAGTLCAATDRHTVALPIGARAATWIEKIRKPKGRLAKLGVKGGHRVRLDGISDPTFADEVASAGATILPSRSKTPADLIFLELHDTAALSRLPAVSKLLADGGALWLVRTKGAAATVGEGETINAGRAAGLVDTKVVAFSDSHSALRFVRRRTEGANS